ncbi:MAG: TetR/AcrR family transcriptional regulator [Parvibaculum sp.]|uniref:TetR/AcrR family transcriptional regulator n=1 Tax=Parvibaculum sp. TaxID=2024848 RepID=UPI003C75811F
MGLEQYRRTVSETKRASILKAGRENFLKNGFSRAAVADIAREADVSTATLYKHFSSKDELFAAVVHDAYGNIGGEFPDFADYNDIDIREMFLKMAHNYLRVQFDQGGNALLRIVIAEVPTTPKIALDTYETIVRRRFAGLKVVFDHLIERKLMRPHDTEMGVSFISGMIKEAFIWPALFDADAKLPENTDVIIHEAIDLYLARYGV